MKKLQFKDYIFPINPRKIDISFPVANVQQFAPGKGDIVQNLGRRGRVVQCEGEFFGRDVAETEAQLAEFSLISKQFTRGVLSIPGYENMYAYLNRFAFSEEGDGRTIRYTMEFIEDMS